MGFREYYQIWFKRVESKNNISQFAFKIHRNQTSATFPQTQKEIIINEKAWQLAKEYIIKIPSLSGTDNEVMVQPRLVMSTRIVPLLSSKSSGFRFWSAIGFSFSLRIERERESVCSVSDFWAVTESDTISSESDIAQWPNILQICLLSVTIMLILSPRTLG